MVAITRQAANSYLDNTEALYCESSYRHDWGNFQHRYTPVFISLYIVLEKVLAKDADV